MRLGFRALRMLGAMLLVPVLLSGTGAPVRADSVATVVRGTEPDGSERLLEDLALLWRANSSLDGSWLAVKQQADARERLRAVRLGRAEFAVVDAASFSALHPDFPELVVLSALAPLVVHAIDRSGESGPLRLQPGNAVPGILAFTGHARFVAEPLAEQARAPGAPAAAGPLLRAVDPPGAIDLLRKGLPSDTLVLLAAPLGTQEIAAALRGDPALRLRALSPALLGAVRGERPWVFTIPVARGTYPNQAEGVEAPAVHLLLVTLAQLSQDDARRMLDCLYGRREQVAPFNALFAAVDRRVNADFAKWAPYHAAAVKYFGLTP
jgi:hypothetical protein